MNKKLSTILFCILAFLFVIPAASAESGSTIVYITNSGTKYHNLGCQFLSDSCSECTLEAAVASGYEPCKKCKPPILSSVEIIDSSDAEQTPDPVSSFSEPVQKIETISDSSEHFENAETVSRSSPSFSSEPDSVSPSVDQLPSSAPLEKASSFSEKLSDNELSDSSESETSGAGAAVVLIAAVGFIIYRKKHKK